ncbi:hypothetical protein SF23_21080 [Streptomyces sp. MBRL 10]|nr:hypothetical protein SF23_21080 [Streptomyces sp. MBRL 10]
MQGRGAEGLRGREGAHELGHLVLDAVVDLAQQGRVPQGGQGGRIGGPGRVQQHGTKRFARRPGEGSTKVSGSVPDCMK